MFKAKWLSIDFSSNVNSTAVFCLELLIISTGNDSFEEVGRIYIPLMGTKIVG